MIKLKKEQEDAINHENGNLLVSASAGSGKTFVMISRLIRLVKEKKADVNEILAMTYTESAATDMKEKLKKALVEEIMKTGDKHLLSQCKKVATADISTIHAFCSRLVRVYFYVAGVSHDFGICEGITAERLKNEAVNKTLKYFYASGDASFKKVASYYAYKRRDDKFKQNINFLYEYFNTEADPDELLDKFSDMYSKAGLERFKKELVSRFKEEISGIIEKAQELSLLTQSITKPKVFAFTTNVCSAVLECANVNSYEDLLRVKSIKINASTETKLDEVDAEIKEQAKSVRDSMASIIDDYTTEAFDDDKMEKIRQNMVEHVNALIGAVKKYKEYYSGLKAEENLLDFDDLQHYALKVLENEEVLNAVKNKYKYIFVDEYQDVNGVQEKILNLIAKNNVFMVGDVKQSIYGFRGCRSDFFLDKFNEMSKVKGQTALLNHSFRSSNKVIDTVNEVFNYCMTGDDFGLDYKKTSNLTPGGVYIKGCEGRANMHVLYKPQTEKKPIESARVYNLLDEVKVAKKSVSKLSSLITKIINDETLNKYYNTKSEKEEFITYKDIAVLVRKNKDVAVQGVISGLRKHGIPVIAEASENILDYPEISTLVSLLKLIDCFVDDVALATVLKSPIANFTDEDLMQTVSFFKDKNPDTYGSFYDAYAFSLANQSSPVYEKIKVFDEYFDKIREIADYTSIADTLEKIVKDKCLEAYYYAKTDGENKVKRIRKFLAFCRQDNKPYTAKDIVKLIEENSKGIPFMPVEDANAVTVMTIHGSKGLEFPVVIVCGLEKDIGTSHESDEYLCDRDDGVAIKFCDEDRKRKENIWRKVFKKRMRIYTRREEMRILYVALTRATYSLHMVAEVGEGFKKTPLKDSTKYIDFIPDTLPATTYTYDDFDFEELSKGTRGVIIQDEDKEIKDKMVKNFAFSYPYISDVSMPLKSSVTATLSKEDTPSFVMYDEYEGVTDKDRGIIAHKFLEHVDFALDINKNVEIMLNNGILTTEELNKIDLSKLEKALESSVFNFSKSAKILREKIFLVNTPANLLFDTDSQSEILLQGVIDLLVFDDDGIKIVDYKYSSLNAESLRAKYKKQLDLYAYAVEKVFGVKVKEKAIVSLLTGEVIPVD